MNKNFGDLDDARDFRFSIIFISETWDDDDSFSKSSCYQLKNYNIIH